MPKIRVANAGPQLYEVNSPNHRNGRPKRAAKYLQASTLITHHLIAGSSTLLLTGLRQLLSERGARVTLTSVTEYEILGLVQSDPPDFFWMEPQDHRQDIMLFYRQLTTLYPKLKAVVFYDHNDPKTIRGFLQAGAAAYLLPNCTTDRVREAIIRIAEGSVYIDPALYQHITNFLLDPGEKKRVNDCSLTRREKEVLRLIVEENTTREIAKKLYINFCTVETHRLHLIQKMGVKNTAGLVREAVVRQLYAHP